MDLPPQELPSSQAVRGPQKKSMKRIEDSRDGLGGRQHLDYVDRKVSDLHSAKLLHLGTKRLVPPRILHTITICQSIPSLISQPRIVDFQREHPEQHGAGNLLATEIVGL